MHRPSVTSRVAPSAVAALIVAALLGGCGGGSGRAPATTAAAAPPVAFPKPGGRTLAQLRAPLPRAGAFAPSVSLLHPGRNRIGFALFDTTQKQIQGVPVALYVGAGVNSPARGPYPARYQSLTVRPPFQSKTVADDPGAARGMYVADVPLGRGKPVIFALAYVGGKLVTTSGYQEQVPVPGPQPPEVGRHAISVHTPTVASAGGDSSKIDTRQPPAPDLQRDDLASVLGHRPVVLMFATPQLCTSRVCGPVVDIEEQVRAEMPAAVAFIHVEIYKDNTVSHGFLPQVGAYRLPTEPWTFVIDRHGVIAARFEGAISAAELTAAVKKVQ